MSRGDGTREMLLSLTSHSNKPTKSITVVLFQLVSHPEGATEIDGIWEDLNPWKRK